MDKTTSTERTPRAASLSRRTLVQSAVVMGAAGTAAMFPTLALAQSSASNTTALPTKERNMMLATTKVEDFDRFLKIFSTKSLEKRKQHGSKGAVVYRDPNESDRVWVLFDWDDKGWQSFVSDPEVAPIMKEAGHTTKAQVAKLGAQYGA
jgi:hypothetical protein